MATDGQQLSLLEGPDAERWTAAGFQVLASAAPEYPGALRVIRGAPPILFVAGHLRPQDAAGIAVIGSRNSTASGRATAATFAGAFSDAGITVVSGLAAGIDTAAHEAALAHPNGRTVAVIGTGLNHAYPRENAALQRRIAETGAVVSQFAPDTRPSRKTFPARNAVMSALSRGSVIIEASERSGVRILARYALAQGRPVFLHERLTTQQWARELADRDGVHVVHDPADALALLHRTSQS